MTPTTLFAVVVLALAVRLAAAAPITFPALDDPAFYLTVGRNLAAGRGLLIDAIWSYQYPFASVTHPSNEYWMPLAAFVFAPFFAVFGPDFRVAQAVGCGLGALLPLPAMWTAAALAPAAFRKQAAMLAGILTALNPLLVYQAVVPDSGVVFSLAAGAALWLAGITQQHEASVRRAAALPLLTGLAVGLGYLARADGLFLLPVIVWYGGLRPHSVRATLLIVAGFLLAAGPWWVRQMMEFGSPFPVSGLVPALLPDYAALFSWPSPAPAELLADAGLARLLTLRAEGLAHNSFAVLVPVLGGLAPFVLLRTRVAWQYDHLRPLLTGTAVLFLASALLFPVATMHGTFYHSLGAALPALTGIGAAGLVRGAVWWDQRRGWQRSVLGPLAAGLVVLTAAQTFFLVSQAAVMHRGWQQQFAVVGAWLRARPPAVVMTTQPYTLNYATGIPAVMVPPAQPPAVALVIARRYEARYLVLTERSGQYPDALDPSPPGFKLELTEAGIQIYEVTPP